MFDQQIPMLTYLPVLISLKTAKELLDQRFEHIAIDTQLMLGEIIKGVFVAPTTYRVMENGVPIYVDGAMGIFKQMRPLECNMADFDVSLAIHEAEIFVIDEITAVLPEASGSQGIRFHYPGGSDVFIFKQVNPELLPEDLKSKVVPHGAINHLIG